MVIEEVEELGAADALVAFGDLRRTRDRASRDIFVLAAHFADLYNADTSRPDDLRTLPGMERAIALAGEGAPLVLEFAIAEMAAELALTTWSAKRLIGDALETRHRLPRIWARVVACEVPAWIARRIAQATRLLTQAQAAIVDDRLVEYADGRLPFSRFADLLEAAVVAADPDAAAARERAAAVEQFAKIGQSNQHGQKTLYVRTGAAEMARIDATIAYLADALKALGDPDPENLRRSKAVLILANPTQAVALLQAVHTQRRGGPAGPPAGGAGGSGGAGERRGAGSGQESSAEGSSAPGAGGGDTDPLGVPPWDELDTPLPEPDEDEPAGREQASTQNDAVSGEKSADGNAPARGDESAAGAEAARGDEAADGDESADVQGPARGEDSASGEGSADATKGAQEEDSAQVRLDAFRKPFHPHQVPPCGCRGGRWLPDTADLLPRVTLYLHLHADSVADGNGVVRWEGEGPVTADYVRDLLGPFARFTVKPVIDPAGLAPVDAYEVPDRHREALHLRTPADVFPFAPNTGRSQQVDHTERYRPPDRGAPTGQTGLHNLGKMTTYHHRVKTHAGWQLRQPFPGIYLWRTPHGAMYLVDHTGTRQIRRPEGTAASNGSTASVPRSTVARAEPTSAQAPVSVLEEKFAALVAAA